MRPKVPANRHRSAGIPAGPHGAAAHWRRCWQIGTGRPPGLNRVPDQV